MTKSGVKTEDYREITPYWANRLCLYFGEQQPKSFWKKLLTDYKDCLNRLVFLKTVRYSQNIMTLGYPKSTYSERILKLEHKGIEIRTGNPDWGAEPDKLYFVIKHGKII